MLEFSFSMFKMFRYTIIQILERYMIIQILEYEQYISNTKHHITFELKNQI